MLHAGEQDSKALPDADRNPIANLQRELEDLRIKKERDAQRAEDEFRLNDES